MDSLEQVHREVIECRRCPRLVAWREEVASVKRAAFRDWQYWGRPVPGFGDPDAKLLVLGLAPAAHGGNRTGRVFTGDRSGDWLYRALHQAGYASQPTSHHRHDGLRLTGAYVTAAVRCAPPHNRPTPTERRNCLPYLERELKLLGDVRVVVSLGSFAYSAIMGLARVQPRPPFGHGVEARLPGGCTVLCSYHPSQQNTFTGRLTEEMFSAVFQRARELAGGEGGRPQPRHRAPHRRASNPPSHHASNATVMTKFETHPCAGKPASSAKPSGSTSPTASPRATY